MMPGDQVVGVRPVAGDVDRAAEDVPEEQHEDHGLDRCEDDDLRRARERQQVAARDHARVGEERLHARALHRPGGDGAHAAARPLRPKRRRGASLVDRRRGVLGAAAGEREEHVVERGPMDAEVVDRDAGLLDRPRGPEQALDAIRDGDADALAVIVDRHALVEDRLQQLGQPRQVAGAGRVHLEHVAADVALELVGGAERDHLPVVDHGDAIRQAVGLVEVLGGQEQRRAVVDELGDELPEVDARARVEPGRRLVHQQDPRTPDEARAEIEPAPHAARVGADEPLGGVGEAEAGERIRRAHLRVPAAQAVQLPHHLEVLAPRERLVDRCVLACEAEQPSRVLRSRDDVDAVDARRARVGDQQRREHADDRRLAGAVRAEQPEHGARRAPRGRRPRGRWSRRTPCGAPPPR